MELINTRESFSVHSLPQTLHVLNKVHFTQPETEFTEEAPSQKPEEEQRLINLWRSVILQAICDLKSNSRKSEAIKNHKTAKKWLTDYNPSFLEACALAELDPHLVVSVAWQIIYSQRI